MRNPTRLTYYIKRIVTPMGRSIKPPAEKKKKRGGLKGCMEASKPKEMGFNERFSLESVSLLMAPVGTE